MATHLQCPECRFPFVLGDDLAGQTFECAQCGAEVQVPEAPPPALPPLEFTERYHQVVGPQTPVTLDLIGIDPAPVEDEDSGSATLRFLWGLRHIVLMLAVLGMCVYVLTSQDTARGTAPLFLAAGIAALVGGYIAAVHIGEQRDMEETSPRDRPLSLGAVRLNRYVFDPIVLVLSDFRAAMPVYRAGVYAGVVLTAALMVGMRAGSLQYLLPASPWHVTMAQASETTPTPPAEPTAPTRSEPTTERAKMVFIPGPPSSPVVVGESAPPAPPAADEQAPPKTERRTPGAYRPEDGPPPPPPMDP